MHCGGINRPQSSEQVHPFQLMIILGSGNGLSNFDHVFNLVSYYHVESSVPTNECLETWQLTNHRSYSWIKGHPWLRNTPLLNHPTENFLQISSVLDLLLSSFRLRNFSMSQFCFLPPPSICIQFKPTHFKQSIEKLIFSWDY